MVTWDVMEPFLNITLRDTPLWYQPSVGKPVAFKLNYNDFGGYNLAIDASQQLIFSVGTNWTTPFRAYVQRESPSRAYVFLGDGSGRVFNPGSTAYDYDTQSKLEYVSGTTNRYILHKKDGTDYVFESNYTPGAANGGTLEFFFLTRIVNPQGRVVGTYTYSQPTTNEVRIETFKDVDGILTAFNYTNAGPYAALISAVSCTNAGTVLRANLSYDANGFLTTITDVMGIPSRMGYDGSNRIATVTTPYGTNRFSYTFPSGETNWYALRVVENEVRTNFWFCGNLQNSLTILPNLTTDYNDLKDLLSGATYVPALPEWGTAGESFSYQDINKWVSIHWGPRQYANLPSSVLAHVAAGTFDRDTDLTSASTIYLGHYKKFLDKYDGGDVGATVGIEKQPCDDNTGATTGLVIFYDYPGKPPSGYTGVRNTEGQYIRYPRYIAYQLPDGNWSVTYREYNSLGNPTLQEELYTQQDGVTPAWRKTTYGYDANGIDHTFTILTDGSSTQLVVTNGWNAYHQVLTNGVGIDPYTYYTYNASQLVTNKLSPTGLQTEYQYTNGFLSKTIDYSGTNALRTNSFTYTAGQLTSFTDERGLTTDYTYDALRRPVTTRWSIDSTGITNVYTNLSLVLRYDRMGSVEKWQYNNFQEVTRYTNANGGVTINTMCTCGALDSVMDPVGNTTSYFYDNNGRLTLTMLPGSGGNITNTYDSVHRLRYRSDSFGRIQTNDYNIQGRLLQVSDASGILITNQYGFDDTILWTMDKRGVAVTQTFDDNHRVLTRTYTGGGVEQFGYSAAGLTSFINAFSTNNYTLDVYGRRTKELNVGLNTSISNRYSPAGDLVALADGNVTNSTTWTYDSFGRLRTKASATGTLMGGYLYDPNGRLITRTNLASTGGGTFVTTYTYDAIGNLKTVTYPTSSGLTFSYDGNNRLTNMVDGIGTTAFSYTGFGAIQSEDGPWASDTVTTSYNAARLRSALSIAAPGGAAFSESYGYDAGERLTSLNSPAGSFGYAYNSTWGGRLEKLTMPPGSTITNDYDAVARLIRTHLRAANGVLTNKHEYSYNTGNQRTNQVRGDATTANDVTVAYTYDPAGQLLNAAATEASGATNRLNEQFQYVYDAAGNLIYRTNGVAGSANRLTQNFTVDRLNELSSGATSGKLTVGGWASGKKPLSVTVADNTTTSAAPVYVDGTYARTGITPAAGANTFVAKVTDNGGRTDSHTLAVNLPTTQTFSYDSRGNLTNDGVRAFFYDEENQLTNVQVTASWKTEFRYDGQMRLRIRREYTYSAPSWVQTNEYRYVYDGKLAVQERDANNNLQVTYTRGQDLSGSIAGAGGIAGLLARTDHSGRTHTYFQCDGSGNVTCLVNEQSVVVGRYAYDPFGNLLAMSGPAAEANKYRFSSKEIHTQSALVYYLYRFYDPNLQRWLNRDPIGEPGFGLLSDYDTAAEDEGNLYTFVDNRPIDEWDLFGLAAAAMADPGNPGPNANRKDREKFAREIMDQFNSWRNANNCCNLDTCTLASQWMYESNWGRSPAAKGKNLGGIGGSGPAGSTGSFKKYNNFSEFYQDYSNLICKSQRYNNAPGKKGKDYIDAVKGAGYDATDKNYSKNVMAIYKQLGCQ